MGGTAQDPAECAIVERVEPLMNVMLRTVAAAAWVSICFATAGCASLYPGRGGGGFDRVMNTAVSSDGKTLAASTVGEKVVLFDMAPLRVRSMLTPEPLSERVRANEWRASDWRGEGDNYWMVSAPLAFSPDGSLLVAAGVDQNIVGWDVRSGQVRFRTPFEGQADDVAFSPDGGSFFVVGPAINRFSAETGRLLGEMKRPGSASATSVAVSPDGRHVFAGLSTGEVAQYDTAAGSVVRLLKKGHVVPVTGVAVAPDGSALASTAGRFDPKFWNLLDDPPQARGLSELPPVKERVEKFREGEPSRQGREFMVFLLSIAVGVGAAVAGVAAPTGIYFPDLSRHDLLKEAATVASLDCNPRIVFSPDGRFVATTSSDTRLFGRAVVVADTKRNEGQVIKPIHGCSVAFSADSRFVITGGPDAPQIWDAETGQRFEGGK
jgi:WD40 repeat protein